jgi:photosystem II stability/assembly factor-like uncharacterized protein
VNPPPIFLILTQLLLFASPCVRPQHSQARERQTFATVFSVRGSVVGSSISQFGPFMRTGDTSWRFLPKANVFSFGMAIVDYGSTRRFYSASGDGLHRTTDGGATWRVLTGWKTMEVLSVVPHPTDSALIYIGTPWGVYRSTDDGCTWEPRSKGFHRFFTVLAGMDRRSPDQLFAMSEDDAYRTTNGGSHWTPLGVNGSVLSFAQHPTKPNILLAGVEDGGIRRSTDDGKTWRNSRGLESSTAYSVSFSPDGKAVYAAGWRTGLWKSTDDGAQWAKLWPAPGIEAIFCIHVDRLNPDHILLGTDGQGVFESFDGGGQWKFAGLDGGKVKQIVIYP